MSFLPSSAEDRAARRKKALPKKPTIRPERDWSNQHGGCLVAGIDEAGRGPLAGPVVAAAVVWDLEGRRPVGLGDSKLLTEKKRNNLFGKIQRAALAWGVGICHAGEIDVLNILEATRVASLRALQQANRQLAGRNAALTVGALVTDALELPAAGLPTLPLIKGDRKSASIAAASILAKVTRDRMMDCYHREFPEYGWDRNKGYPTAEHYEALGKYGPSTLHRLTFNGVGFFCDKPHFSPSYHRWMRRIAHALGESDCLDELATELQTQTDHLPPPDLAALMEAIESKRLSVPESPSD